MQLTNIRISDFLEGGGEESASEDTLSLGGTALCFLVCFSLRSAQWETQ